MGVGLLRRNQLRVFRFHVCGTNLSIRASDEADFLDSSVPQTCACSVQHNSWSWVDVGDPIRCSAGDEITWMQYAQVSTPRQ